MVNIVMSYSAWVLTLLTTLSKSGLLASFRAGALSEYPSYNSVYVFTDSARCDAKPTNLDDPSAHLRSHEKTDKLINTYAPGTLWDEHGIRTDVVVCLLYLYTFGGE